MATLREDSRIGEGGVERLKWNKLVKYLRQMRGWQYGPMWRAHTYHQRIPRQVRAERERKREKCSAPVNLTVKSCTVLK